MHFIYDLNSQIWLNLPRDDCHYSTSSSYGWMIATVLSDGVILRTNTAKCPKVGCENKNMKKKTLFRVADQQASFPKDSSLSSCTKEMGPTSNQRMQLAH